MCLSASTGFMRSARLQPPISAAKATNSTSNSSTTQAKTGSEAEIPTKLDIKLNTTADRMTPASNPRITTFEAVHHLIRVLESESGGESAAADLVARLGARAEVVRELAYRLYTVCERKKRPTEALAYNGLVQSFPEIARLAREAGKMTAEQALLFAEPGH